MTRLRAGFVIIALVLSFFGARLVQLQAIDPKSYAEMAAAEGSVEVVLPAERGDILDRNGAPLAGSIEGLMVVADPQWTAPDAPELARFLATRLGVDYFDTLQALRAEGSRFEYVARRVPSTLATDVLAEAETLGYEGLSTRRDPARDYPAGDVAANLVGFLGTPDPEKGARPLAGFELTFNDLLSGTDGSAHYQVSGGNRIPLGVNTIEKAVDGEDLHTTIDLDLQWYTQRVLRQTVEDARGDSGIAIVMDTRTGELLAMADHPTYDATKPLEADKDDLGSRAISDVYEPGSVEKVLTMASLIDAGKVTPRTRLRVPGRLFRQDRAIKDWFPHDDINLTLTGVLAKSSNIGTVLAADQMSPAALSRYLRAFGLGRRTDLGVRGETPGIIPAGALLTSQTKDRMAFGQSLSVNAVQMAAAVNTVANGGVRVSPSVVSGSATTDHGVTVGTDTATTRQVISPEAAEKTMKMMEKVIDPEDGVAPAAAVAGYRVAGKTGTAQRVGDECGCYDGTFTVSFAGFAPADDPRFTVYVVVQNPRNGGGGGSVGGPAFSKIMGYALRRYAVPPTDTLPSDLPVEWGRAPSNGDG
jgi:cell division protein FtsI (penicillin-binding protein 3)